MMRIRTAVGGLLIAALLPFTAPVPAQGTELPVPKVLPSEVAVPVPALPSPVPEPPKVLPTTVPLPKPLPTVTVTRPPIVVATPVPVPVPTFVPGPERTIRQTVPGPTRTVRPPQPTRTVFVQGPVRVRTVEVPGPVRTVFVPVPGPTQTVVSEKFTPGQERVVRERIRDARLEGAFAGVIAGFLIALVLGGLIYYRGFTKGELYDAHVMRRTL